jgi:Tfp pilus assembly protein PilV
VDVLAKRAGDGSRARRSSGFTLIELAVAMSILMIGIVSVISATSQMHSLRKSNRERTIAQNALRSMAERIHANSYGFSDEIETWAAELVDMYAAGGSHGNTFVVESLNEPATGVPNGSIQIVLDETESDADLGLELGLPRDLNGDGDADDADVEGTARILPVLLTLRWRGENGQVVMRHGFYVMGY